MRRIDHCGRGGIVTYLAVDPRGLDFEPFSVSCKYFVTNQKKTTVSCLVPVCRGIFYGNYDANGDSRPNIA